MGLRNVGECIVMNVEEVDVITSILDSGQFPGSIWV